MAHVDRAALQVLLTPLITSMGSRSHQDLDRTFTKLGLAEPPCPAGLPRSRAQRAHAVAAALADADLVEVAGRVLTEGEADPAARIAIEDVLWAATAAPVIPKRYRHDIAAHLHLEDLVCDERRFTAMLENLWPLEPPNPFEDLVRAPSSSITADALPAPWKPIVSVDPKTSSSPIGSHGTEVLVHENRGMLTAAGSVEFYEDTGRRWLAENGL